MPPTASTAAPIAVPGRYHWGRLPGVLLCVAVTGAAMLLERVEPHLGRDHPTFLTHWPTAQAALARRDPADPRAALRFELFVCGMELANAFEELTDPAEQRARFSADRARRESLYGPGWGLDEELLAALDFGMPQASGIALGFDRLAMIASGADRIEQVIWG